MRKERWQKIEEIFHAATEYHGVERDEYLLGICGDDQAMRAEISALLEEHENPSFTFETPVLDIGLEVLESHDVKSRAGETLGHYKLGRLIGRGGMGEIYAAADQKLGRKVAIKLVNERFALDPERIRRFRKEARTASRVSHPNVASIYELLEVNGENLIVMEFVDGENLRRQMADPISLGKALDIATQIAAALAATHAVGVVHRDIKPENIVIMPDGTVKVLDFGLAKLVSPIGDGAISVHGGENVKLTADMSTELGALIGTPAYMSPEQIRGADVDTQTDIFSLGVLLYEMLTGQLPFRGATKIDSISAILISEPSPVLNSNIPHLDELNTLLLKSLSKEKSKRYQTADEFLADLIKIRKIMGLEAETYLTAAPIESREILKTGRTAILTNGGGLARRILAAPILLAIIVLGGFFGYRYLATSGSAQIESIAVMPFTNETGNSDIEYLSDGMTETLIKALSQLPNLAVKSRSTVYYYKGKETSSKKIGEELNVQAVLLGRVVQRGDDLKLSLELVNTQTQDVLWSEQYNRKQTDIAILQSEIARDVSNKLKTKLSGADEQKLAKTYTKDPKAYTNYLMGRFYWNKRTGNDLRKSVEYYDAAIALDPNFALAYAGLADSYVLLPSYAGAQPDDALPKAKAAAIKAIELDESLAEAHTALSFVYFNYDWKFDESEKEIRRAIALNPNYSTAYHWYGNANLLALGRFDESIVAMKKARELDPLSLIINADLATSYCYAMRLDEAIAQYNRTLEMDSSFYYAYVYLGRAYLLKGDYQNALDELQKASGLESDPRIPMLQSRIYSKMGRRADALRMLDKLKGMQRERYISNFHLAIVYTGLGDLDNAFASLESAYKAHDGNFVYLKADPLLADLHGDPRFKEMLKRLNLPE